MGNLLIYSAAGQPEADWRASSTRPQAAYILVPYSPRSTRSSARRQTRVTGVWFLNWLREPLSVMSHPYINDPKYWHERAEEARSIAKLLNDQKAKRQLLAIAARYDRLADHIKQRPNSQNSN
jgi:hypothetical protein